MFSNKRTLRHHISYRRIVEKQHKYERMYRRHIRRNNYYSGIDLFSEPELTEEECRNIVNAIENRNNRIYNP